VISIRNEELEKQAKQKTGRLPIWVLRYASQSSRLLGSKKMSFVSAAGSCFFVQGDIARSSIWNWLGTSPMDTVRRANQDRVS
jgi:hypothetical protein